MKASQDGIIILVVFVKVLYQLPTNLLPEIVTCADYTAFVIPQHR